MEDARREFQVFLSPSRTCMEYSTPSNVQRVIPVINKFIGSSNSPFTLTQRRSSVYKAVSGISFQESDEKKRTGKKDKSNFKRERFERRSIVMGCERPPIKINETKRSRSLTSIGAQMPIENEYNDNSVKEFVHPFSPTAIQNRLGRQGKSVRARKRASSQSRRCAELYLFDDSKQENQPQPPRRARSASRCRKYDLNHSDEITLKQNRSCSLDPTSDSSLVKYRDINKDIKNKNEKLAEESSPEVNSIVNFDVNDTDWKAYDKIISEKLNTLLKAKEESEGGYFSLERDDCEETNEVLLDADNTFQQDYYTESIYVSPTPDLKREKETTNKFQPPGSSSTRECYDPDDEGLYEEIYFDSSDPQYQRSVEEKQRSSGHTKDIDQLTPTPRILQGPTSTVVYITSKDSHVSSSNNSSLDSNQFGIMDDFLKSKRNIFIEKMNSNYFSSKDTARNGQKTKNIKNKFALTPRDPSLENTRANKFMPKVTLPMANDQKYSVDKSKVENKLFNLSISENGYSRKEESVDKIPPKNKVSVDMKKSKSSGNFEKDFELSDLDFDMFAPKNFNHVRKRHTRAGDSTEYEKSLIKLQQLQFKSISSYDDDQEISHPPNTFKGFLHNSVFNPPECEFNQDYGEPLVITEDQIITCITDSSSDESDDDCENSTSSPWLEANKDFEYVKFQEAAPPRSARRRKKGIAHLSNMLNLPFPNNYSPIKEEVKRQNYVRHTPQRPSRSKRRNKSKKRCEEL